MSTQGFDTTTPPLRTAPGAGSTLLVFLPDTWLLRPSFDMPREGGDRVSKPWSRTVSLGTCSGRSSHRASSLQSACSNRDPTKPEEDCPFRLPSVLLVQRTSCEPAWGSLLGEDFPASSHTRARFHLQPAAKATPLFPSRQPLFPSSYKSCLWKRFRRGAQFLLAIPP